MPLFVDTFCYLHVCFVSAMLLVCSLQPCWERSYLLSLLYVMFSCVFDNFPCGALGQVWYLIVSIADLCRLPCFDMPQMLSNVKAMQYESGVSGSKLFPLREVPILKRDAIEDNHCLIQ